jgi:hypothetical protein
MTTTAPTFTDAIRDKLNESKHERRMKKRVLAAAAAVEGKYVNKLPEADKRTLQDEIKAADDAGVEIIPQDVQSYGKTGAHYVDPSGLRQSIARIEDRIDSLDALETLPETDAYLESLDAMRERWHKLQDAAESAGVTLRAVHDLIPHPRF